MPFTKESLTGISLDSAGLVALADLTTISERTALTGTTTFMDILFLAPGIHTQQKASNVNGGELPITGAMTTGYVFRIENQATVYYLQRVGRPGHLVNVGVEKLRHDNSSHFVPSVSLILYSLGIALTIICFITLGLIEDYWGVGVLGMLMVARALNVIVLRRRAVVGWKGVLEPGVEGDLLILLSQDRWIRMRGLVDDLKLVTSGQWIRDMTPYENFATGAATLLVYCAAALATNASTIGSLFIAALLLISVGLLALCNSLTDSLRMFNCKVYIEGEPISYKRRLDMAHEMIAEHEGNKHFAVAMGLVLSDQALSSKTTLRSSGPYSPAVADEGPVEV